MLAFVRHHLYQIFIVKYYRVTYLLSYFFYLLRKFFIRHLPATDDMVFIVFGQGWILNKICEQVAVHLSGNYRFHHSAFALPPAKAYFFAHYSFLQICLKLNPVLWDRKIFVFYTHPRDTEIGDVIYALNQSTKVICMNSHSVATLVAQGLSPDKATYVIGGADPEIFRGHVRSNGCVGFCTAYYERKSPEKIFQIIKLMSHRKFLLIGRNWEQYENFSEMIALPNFTYVEVPYSEYPTYYQQMDVFVSAATLEGGPIPLIEAMMCNIVPVASNTGFAPDIITHGVNGFLFDRNSQPETICEWIEKAFDIDTDIRETVRHLTWNNFASEILRLTYDPA